MCDDYTSKKETGSATTKPIIIVVGIDLKERFIVRKVLLHHGNIGTVAKLIPEDIDTEIPS